MDCLFCNMINNKEDKKLIYEDEVVIVILDKFPHSDGHSLIIPKTHYKDIYELPDDINNHIKKVAEKIIPLLMDKLDAKGITCLVNYGESQAIKHYHYHIVPNYNYKEPEKTVDEIFELLKK